VYVLLIKIENLQQSQKGNSVTAMQSKSCVHCHCSFQFILSVTGSGMMQWSREVVLHTQLAVALVFMPVLKKNSFQALKFFM